MISILATSPDKDDMLYAKGNQMFRLPIEHDNYPIHVVYERYKLYGEQYLQYLFNNGIYIFNAEDNTYERFRYFVMLSPYLPEFSFVPNYFVDKIIESLEERDTWNFYKIIEQLGENNSSEIIGEYSSEIIDKLDRDMLEMLMSKFPNTKEDFIGEFLGLDTHVDLVTQLFGNNGIYFVNKKIMKKGIDNLIDDSIRDILPIFKNLYQNGIRTLRENEPFSEFLLNLIEHNTLESNSFKRSRNQDFGYHQIGKYSKYN